MIDHAFLDIVYEAAAGLYGTEFPQRTTAWSVQRGPSRMSCYRTCT